MVVRKAVPEVARTNSHPEELHVQRQELIELLNEDLRREYQAIISYVVYSQVLKGAAYMAIAGELGKSMPPKS